MSPIITSFLVFAGIFLVGLLAMRIRSLLPDHHQSTDTKDTVKLAMALVGTMTALLLGLMVASAKGTYDAQKTNVITSAARLVVLDRMLAHYGPPAADARGLLRHGVELMMAGLWPDEQAHAAQLAPDTASGDRLYDAIEALAPQDDTQRTLKTSALSSAIEIGNVRWLLFEQSGRSISAPLLAVVISWLAILFLSFGLFAPANGTAIAALMLSAISVAGAIFLILELDQPFDGLIHISSAPMQSALAHLGK